MYPPPPPPGTILLGRSAEDLLLKLTEKWKLAVDSGLTVGVVFIDSQKAFDTVSHDILAFKLQALGTAGNAFELITRGGTFIFGGRGAWPQNLPLKFLLEPQILPPK